ncbi:MAG: mechanosensitive ion channel family protein [Spirochaetaceae bacterium]|nr:mechanosensitive ion channel family protein [Spirochaetaceae bacterium]
MFLKIIKKAALPVIVLFVVIATMLVLGHFSLPDTLSVWKDRIGASLCVICSAWAVYRVVNASILYYVPKKSGQIELQKLLHNLFGVLIWIIPIILVIHTLGYNVSAILTGVGIGGAALALASQNTLANFFGSIVVFLDKPFGLHDYIKINGFEGEVIDMGLRCSRLKTKTGDIITVPNSMFTSNCIVNVHGESGI